MGLSLIHQGKTYDAIGCKYCNNTGYFDRTGIFELLDLE